MSDAGETSPSRKSSLQGGQAPEEHSSQRSLADSAAGHDCIGSWLTSSNAAASYAGNGAEVSPTDVLSLERMVHKLEAELAEMSAREAAQQQRLKEAQRLLAEEQQAMNAAEQAAAWHTASSSRGGNSLQEPRQLESRMAELRPLWPNHWQAEPAAGSAGMPARFPAIAATQGLPANGLHALPSVALASSAFAGTVAQMAAPSNTPRTATAGAVLHATPTQPNSGLGIQRTFSGTMLQRTAASPRGGMNGVQRTLSGTMALGPMASPRPGASVEVTMPISSRRSPSPAPAGTPLAVMPQQLQLHTAMMPTSPMRSAPPLQIRPLTPTPLRTVAAVQPSSRDSTPMRCAVSYELVPGQSVGGHTMPESGGSANNFRYEVPREGALLMRQRLAASLSGTTQASGIASPRLPGPPRASGASATQPSNSPLSITPHSTSPLASALVPSSPLMMNTDASQTCQPSFVEDVDTAGSTSTQALALGMKLALALDARSSATQLKGAEVSADAIDLESEVAPVRRAPTAKDGQSKRPLRKGAGALLRGLRSGEVERLVDKLEAAADKEQDAAPVDAAMQSAASTPCALTGLAQRQALVDAREAATVPNAADTPMLNPASTSDSPRGLSRELHVDPPLSDVVAPVSGPITTPPVATKEQVAKKGATALLRGLRSGEVGRLIDKMDGTPAVEPLANGLIDDPKQDSDRGSEKPLRKGAGALLRGVKSGEVARLVDKMEANGLVQDLPDNVFQPVADTIERLRHHFEARRRDARSKAGFLSGGALAWLPASDTTQAGTSIVSPDSLLSTAPNSCVSPFAAPYGALAEHHHLADGADIDRDGEVTSSEGESDLTPGSFDAELRLSQALGRLGGQLGVLEEILAVAEGCHSQGEERGKISEIGNV